MAYCLTHGRVVVCLLATDRLSDRLLSLIQLALYLTGTFPGQDRRQAELQKERELESSRTLGF